MRTHDQPAESRARMRIGTNSLHST
jgi:hypothetical protein